LNWHDFAKMLLRVHFALNYRIVALIGAASLDVVVEKQ